jgi:hypothetical protein
MKEKFELDYYNFKYDDHLNTASNPYEDYDKRPIKPLNDNKFQKQLEEYKELSEDEINKLKQK